MEKTYGDDYNKDFDAYAKGSAAATLTGMLIGGIGRGIAKKNQKKAEEIYNTAKDRYMSSYNVFQRNTEKTKKTITSIVCLKKKIMSNYMKSFLDAYKRLAPQVKSQDSQGLGELKRFMLGQEKLEEIRKLTDAYLLYDEQQLGEKASNVALLMVQDGTISNLMYSMRDVIYAGKINDEDLKKSSMDNLKIQSIGVIAEFSTVAVEFGISGISDAFRSGTQVNEAKEAAAQFEYQKEIIDTKNIKITAIDKYAKLHLKLLRRLLPVLEEMVTRSVHIIKSKDNFFHFGRIELQKFTQNELDILAFTSSLVEAVKAVIDSPIICQKGDDVFNGDRSGFIGVWNQIGYYENRCLGLLGGDERKEKIYCNADAGIPHKLAGLLSETVELFEGEDIDEEEFDVGLCAAIADVLGQLKSSGCWLRKLESAFGSLNSNNKKSILSSFENFLGIIDSEVWCVIFSSMDDFINMYLDEKQIDREKALLRNFFEELIDKMEDAINDYYNDIRLSIIVCNLKGPIENFVAEVEYDAETLEMIFDN